MAGPGEQPAPLVAGRRRASWSILGVLVVVVAILAVAVSMFGGRTVGVAGSPVGADNSGSQTTPGGESSSGGTLDDELGWSATPFDQPAPVPGFVWQGWAEQPDGRCAWVPRDLFASLATGPVAVGGHFCHVPLAGGDQLQITWGGTYSAMLYDPIAFSYPYTVAGLEARVYDLTTNQQAYPGSCKVEVNTRSLASFSVLNWNPQAKPADREARCRVAVQAAELIAKRMVPAAGGTVWPSTPQKPSAAAVEGQDACEIVGDLVTTYVGVENVTPTKERGDVGDSCRYEEDGKQVVALVTDGPDQGLARIPPMDQAEVTPRTLGVLPAREEVVGQTCALAVEFLPGRVLRTRYSDDSGGDIACRAAEVLAGQAVVMMLAHTKR